MAIYDDMNKEDLVDLLKAYDNYIYEASTSNTFRTGWTPVGIEEFYEYEYQDIWKKGDRFSDVFFEAVDMAASDISAQSLAAAIDAFYWVYDSYNYQDEILDRGANISQIENELLSGNAEEIKGHLCQELEDRAEVNAATLAIKIIIGQLEQYQKQQVRALTTQLEGKLFGEVSDALLTKAGKGLDVWLNSTDNCELEFADTALHAADYARFSSKDKWLFELPVEKVCYAANGELDSVILHSDLTNDELVFLLGLGPELLLDDGWTTILLHAQQEGASFDDRLIYLKEKIPDNCLESIGTAFDAVSQALETVDLAEINGARLHPSIGNRLVTAKQIILEAVEATKENPIRFDQLLTAAKGRCKEQTVGIFPEQGREIVLSDKQEPIEPERKSTYSGGVTR